MSEITIGAKYTYYISHYGVEYADCFDAGAYGTASRGGVAVGQTYFIIHNFYKYLLTRSVIIFDISSIPETANITGAKLRLYMVNESSNDDYNLMLVNGDFSYSVNYSQWDNFGEISYGSINTGLLVAGWNEIDLNAIGLEYINTSDKQKIIICLRSDRDILRTIPTDYEYNGFEDEYDSNKPELELTLAAWPAAYPEEPKFPVVGKVDLDTYNAIGSYITALNSQMTSIFDGSGNIEMESGKYIQIGNEQITDLYNHVKVDSISALSAIAITDLIGEELIVANMEADSVTITGLTVSYGLIDTYVTEEEEMGFRLDSSIPDPAAGESIIAANTDGDLIVKRIDAIIKTDILADYTGM